MRVEKKVYQKTDIFVYEDVYKKGTRKRDLYAESHVWVRTLQK